MRISTFLMVIVMLLGIILAVGVAGILGIIPVKIDKLVLIALTAIFFLIDSIIYWVDKKGY